MCDRIKTTMFIWCSSGLFVNLHGKMFRNLFFSSLYGMLDTSCEACGVVHKDCKHGKFIIICYDFKWFTLNSSSKRSSLLACIRSTCSTNWANGIGVSCL